MGIKGKESIARGVVLYSIPTWVNIILGFISISVLTRVLKPDTYGLIMIFLSSSNLLLYIYTLGTDGAYIRFFNEPPTNNSPSQFIFKLLAYVLSFSLFLSFIVILLWGDSIALSIFGIESKTILALLCVFTLAQVALRFLNILYRMSFQVKMYNIQNILLNSATRFFILIAALINTDFFFITSFLTIGIFMLLTCYTFIQRKDITPVNSNGHRDFSLSLQGYKDFFLFSLFAAPTYVIVNLNTLWGQQIVRSSLGAYALGIFASTGAFSAILTALKGGFSTFWSAYTYKNYNDEKEKIGRMHDFILIFSIIITSLLVANRDVVYLIIGPEYHESKYFFSLLLVLPILHFVQETTDKGVDIAKKNYLTLIAYIVSVASNVGFCCLLIPKYGLMGAAYANAISSIILFVMATYWGQKYYRTILSPLKSALGFIILVAIMVVPAVVYNIWLIIFSVIGLDIFALFIYRKEVQYLFGYLNNFRKVKSQNAKCVSSPKE